MTNVLSFRSPEQRRRAIREEAAVWLARLDASPEKAVDEALLAWLQSDRRHLEAFLEMAAIWDQSTVLEELSDLFPLQSYDRKSGNREKSWLFPGLAGAMALCLTVLLMTLFAGEGVERMSAVYDTGVGEQQNVVLEDGSELMLNTDTLLRVNYVADERSVTLVRGEALFDVEHDPARPFRVLAGSRVVEAVGTAFTVQHDDRRNNLEIMVTEGEVFLQRHQPLSEQLSAASSRSGEEPPARSRTDGSGVSLRAGQLIMVDESLDQLVQQEVGAEEMQVRLSWQHGMLLFRNEPLGNVLEEVTRYTTTTIEADESVRHTMVEGYFRVGDVDGLLHAMQSNFDIRVQHDGDGHIRLSAR